MARRVVARVLAASEAADVFAVVTAWAGKVGKERGHVRLDDGTEVRVRIGHRAATRVRSPAVGERVRVVIDRAGKRRVFPIDEQARANTWRAPTTPKTPAPLPPMLRRAVEAELRRGDAVFTVAARHGVDVQRVLATRAGGEVTRCSR
jgi:hypothetical protein